MHEGHAPAVWPRQTPREGRLLHPQPKKGTWTWFISWLLTARAVQAPIGVQLSGKGCEGAAQT